MFGIRFMLRAVALLSCWILCAAGQLHAAERVPYSVRFEGLKDKRALHSLESASELLALRPHPPASVQALRYRAEADLPLLIQVLHAYGYYDAKLSLEIESSPKQTLVIIQIDSGPVYTLESYRVYLDLNRTQTWDFSIPLNQPIRSEQILQAELDVLQKISQKGHPLAEVQERKIMVDGKTKTVRIELYILLGKAARFGPTSIVGNHHLKTAYFESKLAWKEGEDYNSALVEKTQTTLINSGLFSSVLISHEKNPAEGGLLPMRVEVSETTHQSIQAGISYQTVFGPGLTFGWENRNVAGMGRRMSLQGDVTAISHTGIAKYLHPDLLVRGQDYVCQAEAAHEDLFAYSMRSYSFLQRLDHQWSHTIRFSAGIGGERLFVTDSRHNGNYWLAEAPLYVRWSTANDLLNPSKGVTVEGFLVPSANTNDSVQFYAIQKFSESAYFPLLGKDRLVFAQKMSIGMSWSPQLATIPLSKRFLGGSEEELRGYRYRTVSPLRDRKPIGGRSAIYITLEARFKITSSIGLVPFFDVGNVYQNPLPTWTGKWRKSTGLGIRYFSFFGPIRLDIAFPLDRRKEIDPFYKILVSIGQTF